MYINILQKISNLNHGMFCDCLIICIAPDYPRSDSYKDGLHVPLCTTCRVFRQDCMLAMLACRAIRQGCMFALLACRAFRLFFMMVLRAWRSTLFPCTSLFRAPRVF